LAEKEERFGIAERLGVNMKRRGTATGVYIERGIV